MTGDLSGSVVILTGASRGLGAAVAEVLGRRKARVALLARSAPELEQVARRVQQAGGEARVCPVDLRDGAAVATCIGNVRREWGRIDVLVNLAGVKHEGPVETTTLQAAQDALAVNYLGPLACCQAVLPAMREQRRGLIVNVSSVLGKRATPQRAAYSASKAALNALTDALRMELAGTGIDVTLVCPGRLADAANGKHSRFAMSVQRAAEKIVSCLDRRPRELILSVPARVLVWTNALCPGWLDAILLACRRRERTRT